MNLPRGVRFALPPFLRHQVSEDVQNGVVLQILELAGIEKRAATHGAVLEPDVRLVDIHHPNHQTTAARAVDAIHLVELLPQLRVADVNGGSAAALLQLLLLELVEEN